MPYLVFLAPGLLAATAMQTASFEATFPIIGGLIWNKVFHAMAATPISPRDVALGNLAWIMARLTLVTGIFTLVIIVFGAYQSPLVLLCIPAAVLTGMAFAGPIAAFAATQHNPNRFTNIFRFIITPLFLFSGTFFPISSLPTALQVVGRLSRRCTTVSRSPAAWLWARSADDPVATVVHLVYLVTLAAVGAYLTTRTIERRLIRG